MVILRCTGTLLTLLRGPAPDPVEASPTDWYANLIQIQRRRCLLLTHAGSLFSVFAPALTAADLRPPGPLVVARIQAALHAEGLPATTFGPLDPHAVHVARTADRRVLGTMNDHLTLIQHVIAAHGGLAHCDLDALHHTLHRTINSLTGYTPPIELLTTTP